MRVFTTGFLLFALLISTSADVLAQRGKGIGSLFGAGMRAANGIKTYDANTLRPEALKYCVLLDRALEDESTAIDAEQANVDRSAAKLNDLQGKIESLSTFFAANENKQMTSQSELDAYNNNVNQYNALLERHKAEVARYTAMADPLNARIEQYNASLQQRRSDCNGKSYYEDDMEQVLAQLQ